MRFNEFIYVTSILSVYIWGPQRINAFTSIPTRHGYRFTELDHEFLLHVPSTGVDFHCDSRAMIVNRVTPRWSAAHVCLCVGRGLSTLVDFVATKKL